MCSTSISLGNDNDQEPHSLFHPYSTCHWIFFGECDNLIFYFFSCLISFFSQLLLLDALVALCQIFSWDLRLCRNYVCSCYSQINSVWIMNNQAACVYFCCVRYSWIGYLARGYFPNIQTSRFCYLFFGIFMKQESWP